VKLSEHFNNIIQLAEQGGIESFLKEPNRKSFGIGGNGISFVGDNIIKFEGSLKALYQSDKSVHDTCSLKQFENKLISFLAKKCLTKETIEVSECESFFKDLLAVPIQEIYVFREVYGLFLEDYSQPYVLGPFTIYHFASHQPLINARTKISPEHLWMTNTPNYLIEVTAIARDSEKAIEKADILFEKFELALRYAIGFGSDKFEAGILNYQGRRHRSVYMFSKEGSFSSSHRNHGSFEPLPIDNLYFKSANAGFDQMWAAMGQSNITELQRRLLLAIEWIGQSYNEISPSSAFLKSAIALEILFTHNEKSIINASILSQIAESIALLLGGNANERLMIEAEVKKLYSMRSAITHAGKTQVAQEDLFAIFHYSREVVMRLMTSASLRDLKSISEIHSHLKSCKYSCAAI